MRDPVALGRYFDFFKHLCAANVLAAPVFVVSLYLAPVGGGPFAALVLGSFFASFVFAAGGLKRAMEGIVRPPEWSERALRLRRVLAVAAFVAGAMGAAVPAVVLLAG